MADIKISHSDSHSESDDLREREISIYTVLISMIEMPLTLRVHMGLEEFTARRSTVFALKALIASIKSGV